MQIKFGGKEKELKRKRLERMHRLHERGESEEEEEREHGHGEGEGEGEGRGMGAYCKGKGSGGAHHFVNGRCEHCGCKKGMGEGGDY